MNAILLLFKENSTTPPLGQNTLMPGDYNSFAMAILSQNHREIDITELISASINVIIALPRGFRKKDIMTIWPPTSV